MPLFPEINPYKHFYLPVGDGHELYVEACGNPKGIPVVFLHGGPGAGCKPAHRQLFDPVKYHIILFDQRGAGRSRPCAETKNNSPLHLICDIELIREHFGIEKWLVFGGSWGSTLALLYGETYPDACLGFILRGIFLMRKQEVLWYLEGVRYFYPEVWHDVVDYCGVETYVDIMKFCHKIFAKAPIDVQEKLAYVLANYEAKLSSLDSCDDISNLDLLKTLALAKIELHYFYEYRATCKHLLRDVIRISHLPCVIVQGRYDMVCPPVSAYELNQAWPGSKLVMVQNAGHSAFDPPLLEALIEAADKFF